MKLGHYLRKRDYFYLMHLSYGTGLEDDRKEHWDYARKNSLIGLDLPDEVPADWNTLSNSEKQSLRLQRPIWFRQFELFCNGIGMDELVVVVNGWDSVLGIGLTIENRYYYRKELSERLIFFDHVRKVNWEMACEYSGRIRLSTRLKGFNNTLVKVKANSRFWEILSNVDVV